MQEHVVYIGDRPEEYREVVFEAKKLGEVSYMIDDPSLIVDQTLFKTEDDRFVIHTRARAAEGDESGSYRLFEVDEEDLHGEYLQLGREAGVVEPLTLDEALEEQDRTE